MKKIFALSLAGLLLLALFACADTREIVDDSVITDDVEVLPDDTQVPEPEVPETPDEPEVPAAPEKDFTPGKIDGSVYENEYIGLGFTLPEGWSFYSEEQIRTLNNAASDMAGEEYEQFIENATIIYDMCAADSYGFNNVNLNFEKIDTELLAEFDFAESIEAQIPLVQSSLENMGYSDFAYEISKVQVGGELLDAVNITVSIEDIDGYMTSIQKACDDGIVTITVTTMFEDTVADVIDNFYWVD